MTTLALRVAFSAVHAFCVTALLLASLPVVGPAVAAAAGAVLALHLRAEAAATMPCELADASLLLAFVAAVELSARV